MREQAPTPAAACRQGREATPGHSHTGQHFSCESRSRGTRSSVMNRCMLCIEPRVPALTSIGIHLFSPGWINSQLPHYCQAPPDASRRAAAEQGRTAAINSSPTNASASAFIDQIDAAASNCAERSRSACAVQAQVQSNALKRRRSARAKRKTCAAYGTLVNQIGLARRSIAFFPCPATVGTTCE